MKPSRSVPHPLIFLIRSIIKSPFNVKSMIILTLGSIDGLTETNNKRIKITFEIIK